MGEKGVAIAGETYRPEAVAALVFRKLKQDAETYLKSAVTGAAIGVPTQFSLRQRRAVTQAAQIAGFDTVRLLTAPAAVSLAETHDETNRTLLVVDVGAATTSVGIIDVGGGVFEVVSTTGDTELGGHHWINEVVTWFCEETKAESGVRIAADGPYSQQLQDAATEAVCTLASHDSTQMSCTISTQSGPTRLLQSLSRTQLVQITEQLGNQLVEPIQQAIAMAGYTGEDIDDVIAVGGVTRLPHIQSRIRDSSGQPPRRPADAVGSVARGAAVEAGVLSGRVDDVVVLDTLPRSLGLEVQDGFEQLIEADTTIPTQAPEKFTTTTDEQTAVELRVFEGENETVTDNEFLGALNLDDIQVGPTGTPEIEVCFNIDENGNLMVDAVDTETNVQEQLDIHHAVGLSSDRVDRLRDSFADVNCNARSSSIDHSIFDSAAVGRISTVDTPEKSARVPQPAVEEGSDTDSESDGSPEDARGSGGTPIEQVDFDSAASAESFLEDVLSIRNDLSQAVDADGSDPSQVEHGVELIVKRFGQCLSESSDVEEVNPSLQSLLEALERIQNGLQMALKAESENTARLQTNIENAVGSIDQTLATAGITIIDPEPGTVVDSTRHQVIDTVSSDRPANQVLIVVRAGYEHENVVRQPAKVLVSDSN